MTGAQLEARRLRAAAADAESWALFAADDSAGAELADAARAARVRADELEGFLPLGVA